MEGPPTAVTASVLSEAGLDTGLLDCWEVTLAMALLAQGGGGVRSVLGSQWWFAYEPGGEAAPRLDFEPQEERCAALTGLRPRSERVVEGGLAAACEGALALGRAPMVVTDAHLLPWCPYAGRKHVEHSFVVTAVTGSPATLRVVDGYDNRTEWGDARPLETTVDAALTAGLERDSATRLVTLVPEPPRLDPGALRQAALFDLNLAVLADWAASEPYKAFIEEHCRADVDPAAFDRFCEACWTIERRRGLYATWLDDLAAEPGAPVPAGLGERFRQEVVARWSDVNRFAYLALRRLRAGRRTPGGLADLLTAAAEAERTLATALVTGLPAPGTPEKGERV
ncbi:hypothetical protein GCM10010191_60930 [Actinomadura vinacea]|uniref:Butirosin biosynthesis protein H N-terminal domain-containing protein n=1 Tax=Actinomadura vinacea TaxID=115336 RepID=A0ABN3JS17_9ACTN